MRVALAAPRHNRSDRTEIGGARAIGRVVARAEETPRSAAGLIRRREAAGNIGPGVGELHGGVGPRDTARADQSWLQLTCRIVENVVNAPAGSVDPEGVGTPGPPGVSAVANNGAPKLVEALPEPSSNSPSPPN